MVEGSVGSVPVVVREILGEHDLEVAAVEDKESVQALPADGTDESLGDRVGAGRLDRGLDNRMPSAAKTASKEQANLASRSRIKNLIGVERSTSSKQTFGACWVTQADAGLAVTPARRTTRDSGSTKNRT